MADQWTYFLRSLPPLGQPIQQTCDYCHRHRDEHGKDLRCPIPNCTLEGPPAAPAPSDPSLDLEAKTLDGIERNAEYVDAASVRKLCSIIRELRRRLRSQGGAHPPEPGPARECLVLWKATRWKGNDPIEYEPCQSILHGSADEKEENRRATPGYKWVRMAPIPPVPAPADTCFFCSKPFSQLSPDCPGGPTHGVPSHPAAPADGGGPSGGLQEAKEATRRPPAAAPADVREAARAYVAAKRAWLPLRLDLGKAMDAAWDRLCAAVDGDSGPARASLSLPPAGDRNQGEKS